MSRVLMQIGEKYRAPAHTADARMESNPRMLCPRPHRFIVSISAFVQEPFGCFYLEGYFYHRPQARGKLNLIEQALHSVNFRTVWSL
jgi:hypothetical protein